MIESVIIEFLLKRGLIILATSYILGESIKLYFPKYSRWIPLLGGITGMILGISVPTVFEDTEMISKLIYGSALGWASTGVKETIKGCRSNPVEG